VANDKDVTNEKAVTAEQQKQLDLQLKLEALQEALTGKKKQTSDQIKENIAGMERQAALYENLGDSEDAKILRAQQASAIEKEKLRLLEAQIKSGEATGAQAMELLKTQTEQVKQADHLVAKLNNATEAIRDGRRAADQLGKSLSSGMISGDLMSIFNVENMSKVIDAFRGGSASVGSFVKSLSVGLFTSFVQKLIEVAIAADEAESGFKRATGASDSMARSLTDNYEQTRLMGVEMKEMSATMESLYGTFTDFTMINASARAEVSQTGALLGEVGVKAGDFAKGMQISTKAFGQTAKGAAAAARDIADFSTIIGVAPEKLGADFANMGGSLAKMGDQGIRAFKDLAIVSKTTGLEMSKILQITDKFDTFEGAAEQAGKLNAALGGNFVNAMDLMMATDPAERFGMIRDSILDTGLTFDDMSYYQRKFYTDSLGLSDVSDLAAMLSGDMSNLEGATSKSSAEYAKLAERTKDIQSITEQFKTLMVDMIPIMTGVIDEVRDWMSSLKPEDIAEIKKQVKGFADALVTLAEGLVWAAKNWKWLAAGFAAFKIAGYITQFVKFKETLSAVGDVTDSLADKIVEKLGDAVGGAVESATDSMADGIENIGEKAAGSEKSILAIGAAVLMIGGGIAIAAFGVAELVKSFSGLGDAAPWAALGLGIFMVAMVVIVALLLYFAPAIIGATIPLLAFGASLLLIGAAIAIAALGMSIMVEAIALLFSSLDVEKMTAFGAFLIGIAASAPALVLAAAGLVIFAAGMGGIALALKLMPEDELALFSEFLGSIVAMETSQFSAIASGIREINTELDKMPEQKATMLRTTMEMATVAQATAGLKATADAISDAVTGLFGDKQKDKAIQVKVDVGDVILDSVKVGGFVKKTMGEVAMAGSRGTG
jgi:hypothetical protein